MCNTFALYKLETQDAHQNLPHLLPPYMERQHKAFCFVHAYNMALGQPVLCGNSLLSHIDNLENNLNSKTNNQINNSMQHLYSKGIGNFTSMIINHFPSHLPWSSERSFYLKYTVTNLQPGQVSKSLIEQLLSQAAHPSAAIFTTTNPHDGQAYASTIKKFNVGLGQTLWHLQDSQNLQPTNLSADEDWRGLQGNIVTLHRDLIWNQVAQDSVLSLAAPTRNPQENSSQRRNYQPKKEDSADHTPEIDHINVSSP